MDVVKIRLQAQQQPLTKGSCFIYCNGLMDHLQVCRDGSYCRANGNGAGVKYELPPSHKEFWYRRPGQFTGTMVCKLLIVLTQNTFNFFIECILLEDVDQRPFKKKTKSFLWPVLWLHLKQKKIWGGYEKTVFFLLLFKNMQSKWATFQWFRLGYREQHSKAFSWFPVEIFLSSFLKFYSCFQHNIWNLHR